MISKLRLDFNFLNKHSGEILQDTDVTDVNDGVKLYIPYLMSNIEKGTPKVYQASTLSKLVFVNDPSNKPGVNSSLKRQNFLTVSIENNSSVDYISSDNTLKKGTKVQCSFTHGLLSKPVFNTDINYK